jgi:hypothetical protein
MDEFPRDEGRRVDRSSREARRRRVRRQRLVAAGAFVAVVCLLGVGAWALLHGGADVAAGESGERAGSAAGGGASPISPSASPSVASASSSPSPSPSATGTPAGSAAASADTVIEIGWVGDTTPGSKYGTPPNGGRALFAAMRRELRAPDLMIANLEGTYSTEGPSKCDGVDSDLCFAFQAPPAYARALSWSGIDLVNLANNHTYDYFQRGLDQTAAALKEASVDYTGLPGQITRVRVRGVRVAVIGFAPYSWCPNVNDIGGAVRLVERAARRADVVVVLMHAGAEGADKTHTPKGAEVAFGEQRGNSRAFAHAVINAGADLVLGSGPHVIRGIERYRGRLVAYSLGNFAGWGNFGLGGNLSLSGLLTVRVDANGRIRGGRWLSVRIASPGVPRADSTHAAARLVRQLSAADFAKTYELDAKGSFSGGQDLAGRRPPTLNRRAP